MSTNNRSNSFLSALNLSFFFMITFIFSFLILSLLTSQAAHADTNALEKCLTLYPQNAQLCTQKYVKNISIEKCFLATKTIHSDFLNESLKQFCFYDVSDFPNLNSCLQKAALFRVAQNHDEAITSCLLQFQENLSSKKCLAISSRLKYPEKKEHLRKQCAQL